MHSKADKITTKRNQQKNNTLVYDTISLHKYAKFKGNPHQIQKKLEENFKKWLPIEVLDSALVFSGIVTKDGKLENVELTFEKKSTFSNNIIKFIERELTSWWPAFQSRPVRYRTKFFVRLEKDSSITFIIKDSY